MSALTPYVSFISGYIPAAVKDAAGLCPKISEAVRHITWLSVERVFWPPQDTVRFVLVLGYTDGFQIWDLQDPSSVHEICSKQDKAVVQARLLPVPLAATRAEGAAPGGGAGDEAPQPLGVAAAPLMAYLHRGSPALVRLFSLKQHDDVHLLRLTEPARSLQASRRFFAVGFARRVELYEALSFQAQFSVDCNAAAGPTFALGHRWLAYNLPPQQPSAGSLLAGGPRQLHNVIYDGLQYLGHGVQRTLDHMLMPPQEGAEQSAPAAAATRGGVVAVRDATSQRVIACFEDHTEPVEAMAWDPSGLQLVTGAALGHRVLVHRALLGAEHALCMHDSVEGGLALGSVVFQHLYTLSRGYTPAVICDIAVSDDGQLVAVSSAKGTTHVFRLPPLHSAALGHHPLETGAVRLTPSQPMAACSPSEVGIGLRLRGDRAAPRPVNLSACTRVRHGHVLLQEGLMPKCGFLSPAQPSTSSRSGHQREACPRMYVATRAGALALYSLSPGSLSHAPAVGSSLAAEGPAGVGAGAGGASGSAGAPGSAAPSGERGGGGAGGDAGDWQAHLVREVRFCRPLRHFTERRLRDLGAAGAGAPARRASAPALLSSDAAAAPSRAASPPQSGQPAPHPSPALRAWASPTLGPRASPMLGPRIPGHDAGLAPPPTADMQQPPHPGGGAASSAAQASAAASAAEHSRWLSCVELVTHAPPEVPVWLSPQLSFHSYPASLSAAEINGHLRAGRVPPGRRRIVITRPERASDGVRFEGGGASSPASEERLSRLFGGALGTTMGDVASPRARCFTSPGGFDRGFVAEEAIPAFCAPDGGSVCVAPAWGSISEQHIEAAGFDDGLEQVDGAASQLEEVEEDWLKA